jgi:hypothetical protein
MFGMAIKNWPVRLDGFKATPYASKTLKKPYSPGNRFFIIRR